MAQEISSKDVERWAQRAVEHCTQIRQTAGLLDSVSAPSYASELRGEFRVGLPLGNRAFVNDDLTEWVWLAEGKKLSIRDARVSEQAPGWMELLREATGGSEVNVSTFTGSVAADPLVAAADSRLVSVELVATLPSLAVVPDGTPDVTLRNMTSRELREFLDITSSELAEQQRGTHPGKSFEELQDRALKRALRQLPDGVSTPGHELYSIVMNGRNAGGLWAQPDGPRVRVWSLVVYEEFRGRSYSRAALAQVASAMSFRGVRFMSVPLAAPNTHARSIFESVGFTLARQNFKASF